jgi:hypothetical protein
MPKLEEFSADMERCIQNCTDCAAICEETIVHCLSIGGRHAGPDHIGLLMDCALICTTSAKFMLHRSPFHTRTCDVCAEVCRACAEECERIAGSDRRIQICVEVCRKCAESCRKMARAVA